MHSPRGGLTSALTFALALALAGPPRAARADFPDAVPYRDGDVPPDGYRLEQRPRGGLIRGGATVFSIGYVAAAIAPAFEGGSRWLYLPLAGPLLAMRGDRLGAERAKDGLDQPVWLSEALQVGGVAMIVSAFVFPSPWWVRERVEVRVGPSSVALVGAF